MRDTRNGSLQAAQNKLFSGTWDHSTGDNGVVGGGGGSDGGAVNHGERRRLGKQPNFLLWWAGKENRSTDLQSLVEQEVS